MICALLNKAPSRVALASGVCQRPGVLGFQPSLVPASGVSCQSGSLFPPDLAKSAPCVNIEATTHRDPRDDLFGSGSSLRHSLFTEKPCDRGNSASLGFAHHHAHFQVLARRVDLCGGTALRSAIVNLNRVIARHRELLRIRVHRAQTVNSLRPSHAFPDAFPLVCRISPLLRCSFDPQVGSCCH